MHASFFLQKISHVIRRIFITRHADASMTSLSSTVSQRDLRIGDRVIVSSSQGSKTGVLRYYGTTEFAVGEWCGVELDDPIGKNDGSVNDKRCASLFQIYTLLSYNISLKIFSYSTSSFSFLSCEISSISMILYHLNTCNQNYIFILI